MISFGRSPFMVDRLRLFITDLQHQLLAACL